MPWNKSTYPPSFNKLSPTQREKAIRIAEGIRSKCVKDGGNEKTCAAKAIRIALWRIKQGEEPMDKLTLAEVTHLGEIKKHFDDRVRGIDVVIDVNHDANSKAAGWIRGLEIGASSTAPNKQALFAVPEWTPYGRELINNGEYRYISAEFGKYENAESGETFSNVLYAVTLTNRPFVKGMMAVDPDAERIEILREGDYMHPIYGQMTIKASEDSLMERIKQTLSDFFTSSENTKLAVKTEGGQEYTDSDYLYVPDKNKPSTWKLRVKEYVDGKKVITAQQLGRAAAALSPKGYRGNRVQLPATAMAEAKSKLRGLYKRIGKEPPSYLKEVHMDTEKKIVDLLAAHGVEVEDGADIVAVLTDFLADRDEKISDLEEELNAEPTEEEKETLKEAETDRMKLQEANMQLAERVATLEQTLKDKDRDVFFDKMLAEGKLRPADVDSYKKLYNADPDTTIKLLSEGPVVVDLTEHGSASDFVEDEDDALLKKVIKLAEEKGISRDEAFDLLVSMAGDE